MQDLKRFADLRSRFSAFEFNEEAQTNTGCAGEFVLA